MGEFQDDPQQILVSANAHAARRGSGYIGTGHHALGLLDCAVHLAIRLFSDRHLAAAADLG